MRPTLQKVPPLGRALTALALVIVLGLVFNGRGTFFSAETHLAMLRASSVTGILAVGMTLVILTAGIDLSVGAVLAFCGMLFAALSLHGGYGALTAVLVAVLAGAALGAANGTLTARLGLQPFIATLAMMAMARGMAKYLPVFDGQSAGTKIMPPAELIDGTGFMQALSGAVLGVPVVGLLFVAVAGAAAFALHYTRYGRHVFAVGGNEAAAHLAGIPVARVKTITYTVCGGLAGLAAVAQVAQSRIGDPEAGTMFELKAIAAVVIGGTSLMGGKGGVLLTLVGVLTIGYIEKILSINGVQEHWRLIIQGAMIVVAVLFQRRR